MPCTPIMAFAIDDDMERVLERILATSGLAVFGHALQQAMQA